MAWSICRRPLIRSRDYLINSGNNNKYFKENDIKLKKIKSLKEETNLKQEEENNEVNEKQKRNK